MLHRFGASLVGISALGDEATDVMNDVKEPGCYRHCLCSPAVPQLNPSNHHLPTYAIISKCYPRSGCCKLAKAFIFHEASLVYIFLTAFLSYVMFIDALT